MDDLDDDYMDRNEAIHHYYALMKVRETEKAVKNAEIAHLEAKRSFTDLMRLISENTYRRRQSMQELKAKKKREKKCEKMQGGDSHE